MSCVCALLILITLCFFLKICTYSAWLISSHILSPARVYRQKHLFPSQTESVSYRLKLCTLTAQTKSSSHSVGAAVSLHRSRNHLPARQTVPISRPFIQPRTALPSLPGGNASGKTCILPSPPEPAGRSASARSRDTLFPWPHPGRSSPCADRADAHS